MKIANFKIRFSGGNFKTQMQGKNPVFEAKEGWEGVSWCRG
jgi:hypothetical protein